MNNSIEKRRGKFVRLGKLRQSTGSGKIKEIKNDVSVDDLFITCSSCEQEFSKETIKSNLYVCPNCGHHYAMPPEKRISALMDEGSFKVFNFDFPEIDPLNFEGYVDIGGLIIVLLTIKLYFFELELHFPYLSYL